MSPSVDRKTLPGGMVCHSYSSAGLRWIFFLFFFKEMTAEYACTRKQFNKKLSEFGLIQVKKEKEKPKSLYFVLAECKDVDYVGVLLAVLV